MDLPRARAVAPLLEVVDSAGSTNAVLADRERRTPQPHGTAIVTLDQTAGRGRLERRWTTPPGAAVAISVLLRLDAIPPGSGLPWLPIVGGLAARDAVAAALPGAAVTVKWPNDVLVGDRKIAGILAELVAVDAVVLGVGVNTAMPANALPVPTATSLAVERAELAADPVALADAVVADVLDGILRRVGGLLAAGGDAETAGLASEARARLGSLGRAVRVDLPDGSALRGTATGLDRDGALLVDPGDGVAIAVHAGDVTHLRYE